MRAPDPGAATQCRRMDAARTAARSLRLHQHGIDVAARRQLLERARIGVAARGSGTDRARPIRVRTRPTCAGLLGTAPGTSRGGSRSSIRTIQRRRPRARTASCRARRPASRNAAGRWARARNGRDRRLIDGRSVGLAAPGGTALADERNRFVRERCPDSTRCANGEPLLFEPALSIGAECTHFGSGVASNDAFPQRGWPCCGSFFSSRQTWRSWCS